MLVRAVCKSAGACTHIFVLWTVFGRDIERVLETRTGSSFEIEAMLEFLLSAAYYSSFVYLLAWTVLAL